MKKQGKIFIISGPSGSGQDSVIEGLVARGWPIKRIVTTITREPRVGEKEGQPYYFIAREEFEEKIKQNEFVEWAMVYGDYRGCTYGELERVMADGGIGVWRVDTQGVEAIKSKIPEAVSIYIKPPSLEAAVARIRKRGLDSEAVIEQRIEKIKEYLKPENDKKFDYIVINEEGELEQTIDRVGEIIEKNI